MSAVLTLLLMSMYDIPLRVMFTYLSAVLLLLVGLAYLLHRRGVI